ncbi:protein spindle-F [Vanessa tameamea]|uniref:Protein spindle-F n=1 Tax=Vanessa tameamea TaxID=334116 RepID=A0A8B8IJZ0_VANTA|nr:protein spindle-F [Vanessa tameamea]XP_026496692.1 protein spindle-F [Vanessa tameamea]
MDSSSIVSFNNDSTYQTTIKADYNNVSVHELALHAMRDRCLLLQRRINTLETDNMRLKLDTTKARDKSPYTPLQEDEKLSLQLKIAELKKQKSQLLHHVFMVSCENKNLWNKLSSLKGSDKAINDHTKQPLVRTNTYIHSTPKYNSQSQEKYSDSSLEEISLKLINSYIQEKSQLVEQYEQMAQLQDEDDNILNVDSIGFTYMEDPATDSLKEIHSQTEKLQSLKKELSQQEKDLKIVVSRIETLMKDGLNCPTCLENKSKTSYANKETETSESLLYEKQLNSISYNNDFEDENTSINKISSAQEINSEPYDKMCPMCGEKFQKETVFTDFQSHVESHFVGNDNEADSIDNLDTLPDSFDNII